MPMFSPARRPEPTAPAPDTSNGAPTAAPIPTSPQRSAGGILSAGVSIKGSLTFGQELELDCEVDGTIDSEGRLIVAKNARIHAEIHAGSVTVLGTVEGNVTATERCELRAGCSLHGDIEAPRLVVDDDATFVGSAKITKRPSATSR